MTISTSSLIRACAVCLNPSIFIPSAYFQVLALNFSIPCSTQPTLFSPYSPSLVSSWASYLCHGTFKHGMRAHAHTCFGLRSLVWSSSWTLSYGETTLLLLPPFGVIYVSACNLVCIPRYLLDIRNHSVQNSSRSWYRNSCILVMHKSPSIQYRICSNRIHHKTRCMAPRTIFSVYFTDNIPRNAVLSLGTSALH